MKTETKNMSSEHRSNEEKEDEEKEERRQRQMAKSGLWISPSDDDSEEEAEKRYKYEAIMGNKNPGKEEDPGQEPFLESQIPDDLPRQEDQDEPPPEDEWECPSCKMSPCLFIQAQEEVERVVSFMAPETSNVSKRFHLYRHWTMKLHGRLAKHDRRRLPECFELGLRELYPSGEYRGYQPSRRV
jgi:hypothetical protein